MFGGGALGAADRFPFDVLQAFPEPTTASSIPVYVGAFTCCDGQRHSGMCLR